MIMTIIDVVIKFRASDVGVCIKDGWELAKIEDTKTEHNSSFEDISKA